MQNTSHDKLNEMFERFPKEIADDYNSIDNIIDGFNTFDLLSNISFYNSIHDTNKYTDYRGDKHFFIAEVIALICLKKEFITETNFPKESYQNQLKEIQELTLRYCTKNNFLNHKRIRNNGVVSEITQVLTSEELSVRNPGLPDHHYIISEKLFSTIDDYLIKEFGFSIKDSIKIRKNITKFLNERYFEARGKHNKTAIKLTNEVKKFRKTRLRNENSEFTIELLEELSLLHYKKVNEMMKAYLSNEMHYNFGKVYTFGVHELSSFINLPEEIVKAFLDRFSCTFPSLNTNDEVYSSNSILKKYPILKNDDLYIVPSFPQLTWAVENVIEDELKLTQKLNTKWSKIKHDFLLEQGLEYLSVIMPNSDILPPNLYYNFEGNICETDGLIVYDKVLIIIEAKGHRISQKSKSGYELKTKDHLEDIIKHSYNQGVRTLNYIENNSIAEFRTKKGQKHVIKRNEFDDVIIISLTLEPFGRLAMLIKATNEIGYFNDGHFPLIISLYDLIVIADLFDNPLLFVHYIKQRKAFLNNGMLKTHEELDLIGYFLYNGLEFKHNIESGKNEKMNLIYYAPESDEINDYYMYKFGYKEKFTPIPKSYLHSDFNQLLIDLDKSKVEHRVKIALMLLQFSSSSISQLMSTIKKTKKEFLKDGNLHDCSVFTHDSNGIGITYMTHSEKEHLDYELSGYCNYKLKQLNSNAWLGIGDVSTDITTYNFKSMYLVIKENLIFDDLNS